MFRVQIADEQLGSAASSAQSSSSPRQKPHISFASTVLTPPAPPVSVPETLVQTEDVEMKEAVAEEKATDVGTVMSSYDALQLLRDSSFDAVSRTAITTLMKIVTNILSDPGMFSIHSTNGFLV